jgi:hypothetical protein
MTNHTAAVVLAGFLALACCPSSVYAKPISAFLGDTAFDLEWESSLQEVQKNFPHGKVIGSKDHQAYSVESGHGVLGFQLMEKDSLKFFFDYQGRLTNIRADFGGDRDLYATLKHKMTTIFGVCMEHAPTETGPANCAWPKSEGIEISLTFIPGARRYVVSLNIQNAALNNP